MNIARTMALTPDAQLRPAEMLAKPVWLDPAFEDPEAVLDLVRRSAPYPLSARLHKKNEDGRDIPFFRIFWAHTRQVRVPGAEPFFHNERFMAAARESFGAEVIEPSAIMINLSCPTVGSPPHRDLPYFRGCEKFPFWMLQCMGYSNRFHDWAVPIASTLSWFYTGEAGEFEYWPEGPDAPSVSVTAPMWNVGVVADNEYMWHRVGPVGREADWLQPGDIGRECRLHAVGEDGWEIHDEGRVLPFRGDQVRLSILWKAYAFRDQAAADEYHNRSNDLDHAKVKAIFEADLRERGVDFAATDDPVGDPAWKAVLQKTYPPGFAG